MNRRLSTLTNRPPDVLSLLEALPTIETVAGRAVLLAEVERAYPRPDPLQPQTTVVRRDDDREVRETGVVVERVDAWHVLVRWGLDTDPVVENVANVTPSGVTR